MARARNRQTQTCVKDDPPLFCNGDVPVNINRSISVSQLRILASTNVAHAVVMRTNGGVVMSEYRFATLSAAAQARWAHSFVKCTLAHSYALIYCSFEKQHGLSKQICCFLWTTATKAQYESFKLLFKHVSYSAKLLWYQLWLYGSAR